MELLKKIAGWMVGLTAMMVIAYNFFNGWLINLPQPRVFKDDGKLWVAEPSSAFMHYIFGSEILREARWNPLISQYEFKKDGRWIPVPNEH